jgi:uncharacterized repeat protein (TIGR01451 family)/fimbrial isopeptide formation D2 family protein
MRRPPAFAKSLRRTLWLLLVLALPLCLPRVARAQVCATPGKDGPGGSLSGVINTYYPGSATVSSGSTSISIGSSRIGGASTSISTGDLLLVIQMQDAAINTTDGTAYGANNGTGRGATSINGSGLYEYVVATNSVGLGGGSVTIRGAGAGNGLVNTYTDAAPTAAQGQRQFQVVRVPQYSSASLTSGLTAAPWDSSTGGVLAFDVAGNLNLNSATVSVDGLGFRGGGGRPLAGGRASAGVAKPTNTNYVYFSSSPASSTAGAHGTKGEGIAGTPRYVFDPVTSSLIELSPTAEGYPGGANARGAPGNAGGGGTDSDGTGVNQENSGGGGGGNGGIGGVGGNTWNSNAATGGIGGALVANAANRIVLGGGGGAGSRNNSVNYDSSGASGGGIVLVRAATVSGSGTITANGYDATNNTVNDGGGGGGAGGSVIVAAGGSLAGLTVRARGGRGGDAWRTGGTVAADRHGPGGGGAGGFIAQTGGASTDVAGGSHGVTTTLLDAYGSTDGASGSLLSITRAQIPGASSGAQCVPALTVTKTTTTASVTNSSAGVTAIYTITVSNAANLADATQVNISDALPTSFTYASTGSVTLTGSATRTSTTNPTVGDTNPNWGVFTIPASGQVRITFTVNIARGVASGTYQNPATATYLDPARTIANGTTSASYNSASSTGEDVTVTATPDLTIAKSHTGNFTQSQTGATYTITATNSTTGQTSGTVTVADTLPASLTPTAASGTGWTCNIASQVVTCTRSDALVAPNSYPAITVTVNVSATAPASVTNTASVSGGGETNAGNDSASDATTINQLADLTVAKTHPGNFTRGSTGIYSITVTNSGSVATDGTTVTVSDTVPAGLTPTAASGTGWTCNIASQVVTCTRTNVLNASASYPAISITVGVAQNAASSLTNTASVSGGGQANTANDTSSDATTIVSSSDLSLTKVVTTPGSGINSNVTFTVTLTNSGPTNATNVAVKDQLPSGLTYISSTPSVGAYDSGTGLWTIAALASGSSATLQLVARIDTLGSLTNTAQVTASDQPDPDSTPNNNNAAEDDQASASLSTSPPSITLCKTIVGQPCPPPALSTQAPGSDISYSVTFTNSGGSFASNFVITDPIPTNTDIKVGSESHTTPLPTGLTGVAVEYFDISTSTWIANPVSGGGGAPAGYNRNITIIRWTFTGQLSQLAPNNTGNVRFTVRIR